MEEDVPEDILRCPITLQPLRRPVVTPSGNTYEYSPLKKLIRENPQMAKSPQTRQPLKLKDLRPNRYAVNQIEQRAKQLMKEYQVPEEDGKEKAEAATSSSSAMPGLNQTIRGLNQCRTYLSDFWKGYNGTVYQLSGIAKESFEPPRAIVDYLERDSELTLQLLQWHKTESKNYIPKGFTHRHQSIVPRELETAVVAWLDEQDISRSMSGSTRRARRASRPLSSFGYAIVIDAFNSSGCFSPPRAGRCGLCCRLVAGDGGPGTARCRATRTATTSWTHTVRCRCIVSRPI
uniref:U-box domain-containing protein n=1 Tax=Vitrella brassicaformis TaxID=1169539 RepID=A0A7S1KEM7_9ALVE